jgi:uncharacterized protein YllA (UPF0747 family)
MEVNKSQVYEDKPLYKIFGHKSDKVSEEISSLKHTTSRFVNFTGQSAGLLLG